jgi:hypothetical protein
MQDVRTWKDPPATESTLTHEKGSMELVSSDITQFKDLPQNAGKSPVNLLDFPNVFYMSF